MPFAPATQFLFDQYGQDTGVNDRKRRNPAPRYARSAPETPPQAVEYAPNSPLGQAPEPPPANTPPPQVMKQLQSPGIGARPATTGDEGARLPWPRIGPDYFDEDRRY